MPTITRTFYNKKDQTLKEKNIWIVFRLAPDDYELLNKYDVNKDNIFFTDHKNNVLVSRTVGNDEHNLGPLFLIQLPCVNLAPDAGYTVKFVTYAPLKEKHPHQDPKIRNWLPFRTVNYISKDEDFPIKQPWFQDNLISQMSVMLPWWDQDIAVHISTDDDITTVRAIPNHGRKKIMLQYEKKHFKALYDNNGLMPHVNITAEMVGRPAWHSMLPDFFGPPEPPYPNDNVHSLYIPTTMYWAPDHHDLAIYDSRGNPVNYKVSSWKDSGIVWVKTADPIIYLRNDASDAVEDDDILSNNVRVNSWYSVSKTEFVETTTIKGEPQFFPEGLDIALRFGEEEFTQLGLTECATANDQLQRIHFVDNNGNECPFVRAAYDGERKSALFFVQVLQAGTPVFSKYDGDYLSVNVFSDSKADLSAEEAICRTWRWAHRGNLLDYSGNRQDTINSSEPLNYYYYPDRAVIRNVGASEGGPILSDTVSDTDSIFIQANWTDWATLWLSLSYPKQIMLDKGTSLICLFQNRSVTYNNTLPHPQIHKFHPVHHGEYYPQQNTGVMVDMPPMSALALNEYIQFTRTPTSSEISALFRTEEIVHVSLITPES